MKKIFWGVSILVVLISIGVFLLPAWAPKPADIAVAPVLPTSPLDATYTVDGGIVALKNGEVSYPATSSPSDQKVTTKIFGAPTMGDLDGDGDSDAALLLQESSSGSGTFYYLVAAINTGHGYQGTNAIFLGDRIAPQTVEIHGVTVVANYADRKPSEPFSAQPSVGKSLYAELRGTQLVAVPTQPPVTAIPSGKACTMEAKLCPDGSYVGRTGPNCEFSPCPGVK